MTNPFEDATKLAPGNPFDPPDGPGNPFGEPLSEENTPRNPFEERSEEEEIVIPSLDDSLDVVISNPFKKSTSNDLVSKNEPNELDPPGVIDDETRGIKTGD